MIAALRRPRGRVPEESETGRLYRNNIQVLPANSQYRFPNCKLPGVYGRD